MRDPAPHTVAPGFSRGDSWQAEPNWPRISLEARGLQIVTKPFAVVQVANGDIGEAMKQAGLANAPIGWPAPAEGEAYAVSLARDKVLMVGGEVLQPGWHEAGFAISEADDSGIIFDVTGDTLPDFLSRGADLSDTAPSRSAARQFAGFPLVLYRTSANAGVRIHVTRPYAAAFWAWMQATTNNTT